MSKLNVTRAAAPAVFTHEGGRAVRTAAAAQLRRTVMSALLWEDAFYENGVSVAERIKQLVPQVAPEDVFHMAVEARQEMFLRHVPLLLVREMARHATHRPFVRRALGEIIKRPDELAEFLMLYWKTNDPALNKAKTLASSVKRGLADALIKFKPFNLAKWDKKDIEVRLRDVMFLTHPKPVDATAPARKYTKLERKADRPRGGRDWQMSAGEESQYLIAQGLTKREGTWEDRMSAGEDPKLVFEDLMSRSELGAMAFIRNLRKMSEVGVDKDMVAEYSKTVKLRGVLPHQILTAARVNPQFEQLLDAMMLRSLDGMEKLPGNTVILVDVSGSMDDTLSKQHKSRPGATPVAPTLRVDAACALAIMARELCEKVRIFTFSDNVVEVPQRRGMALRDAILSSQTHSGTQAAHAIRQVNAICEYTRIIVITDEQSHDGGYAPRKGTDAYIMNVALYENGIGSAGQWITISGWSPQVLRYIHFYEVDKAAV